MESKNSLSELLKSDDIFFPVEIKIGPFKLMNQIGTGKFASVYLGIHEETQQKVAIKQIKKSELNTDNLLLKEINIQKRLFHPYLTQLYCVIEKSENIFLISEYCSKGDIITNLIEKGNFSENYSCKIFQQILSSLEYLHKNNICHRDMKPENILLTENNEAKLSDFGLSRHFQKNELLKTSCGSPLYAAPEVLEGKNYDGTKIDIWGLGISLFTMVCGELPFCVEDENDIKTLIYNITNGYYTIPDNISKECKDLISKMLEINPDKRINIEEIKKHKWVNMFNFNYMNSPGIVLDECLLPVDIYLVKDICGKNENKIRELIRDILDNKHNENTINYYLKNEIRINKGEKSVGDLRSSSELFLNYINSEKSKKSFWGNDIKNVENYYLRQIMDLFNESKDNKDSTENLNKKSSQKKDLEILNLYIGPLIFIHDIIDEIINKVIRIKNFSNKIHNYSVSSITKMEIKNKSNKLQSIKISKENNIDIKRIPKSKENLIINRINNIELISKNEINNKRSMSCKNNNININNQKSNVIKSIDLSSKGILLLNNNNNKISKRKNKSIPDIKHLQINVIENEIIINHLNFKDNLDNDIRLNKNFSQNYSFDVNKNCCVKENSNNQIVTNRKKEKNSNNKNIYSKVYNKSVDLPSKKTHINNYYQKDIKEKPVKNNILLSNYKRFKSKKNNINTFIKTSFNKDKKGDFSSLFSFNSPTNYSKKIISNNFLNNNSLHKRYDVKQKNNLYPIDKNKDNKIIQLRRYNNLPKDNSKTDINKEKIISGVKPIINKNEIIKRNSSNKKKIRNKKEENLLIIKTTVSFDEIRQIIKKFVGNNVIEKKDENNLKFICKTKIGKEDLFFNLELININFGIRTFKGTLIQGETNIYKELLLKIKEKLS